MSISVGEDLARPRVCLPPPPPYTGSDPCSTCRGAGVTGDQYRFDPTPKATTPMLLVDVFCPACLGCGQAGHATCTPVEHAASYAELFDPDGDDPDDDDPNGAGEAGGLRCPSCQGRRWWSAQGYTYTDTVVYELRVACGCATDLLVPAPPQTVGQIL